MLDYMIYLLAFVVGSIVGLAFSYKKHGEPYVAESGFHPVSGVISAVGWILAINSGNVIVSAIGLLLAGFVMGERPGYGRKETAVGLVIAAMIYLIIQWTV